MSFPDAPLSLPSLLRQLPALTALLWRRLGVWIIGMVLLKAVYFLFLAYGYMFSYWSAVVLSVLIEILALALFVKVLLVAWSAWSDSHVRLKPFWYDFLISLALLAILAFVMVTLYELALQLGLWFLHWLGDRRGTLMAVFSLLLVGALLFVAMVFLQFVLPSALFARLPFWQAFLYSYRLVRHNLFQAVACVVVIFMATLLFRPASYVLWLHVNFWQAILLDSLGSLLLYPPLIAYYLLVYRDSQLRYELKYVD